MTRRDGQPQEAILPACRVVGIRLDLDVLTRQQAEAGRQHRGKRHGLLGAGSLVALLPDILYRRMPATPHDEVWDLPPVRIGAGQSLIEMGMRGKDGIRVGVAGLEGLLQRQPV